MKRKNTGTINFLLKETVKLAKDTISQQVIDEKLMAREEVYNVDFKMEFKKELFVAICFVWILFLVIFIKIFPKEIFYAYQRGALFDIASYITWKTVILAIALAVVVIATIFYIVCALRPLLRVQNTNIYYGQKLYHCSEITKLIVVKRTNITKVYVNGKYKFWVSSDYSNYRSFIKWAEKCRIPVEGDTSIRGVNTDFDAIHKKVNIIMVIAFAIMLAFGIIYPIIVVMIK